MMPEQISAVISVIFSLVLVTILVRLRVGSAVDEFRENMFSLREDMFIYAAREGLLADPAYTELREVMNGFIRFGHRLSLFYWASRVFAAKQAGFNIPRPEVLARWDTAMSTISSSHSNKLRNFHSAEMILILHYVLRKSLIVSCLISAYSLYRKLYAKSRPIDQEILNAVGPDNLTILEGEAVCYAG